MPTCQDIFTVNTYLFEVTPVEPHVAIKRGNVFKATMAECAFHWFGFTVSTMEGRKKSENHSSMI